MTSGRETLRVQVDPHTSPSSGTRTVLVVDDDQDLLDVIQFVLEGEGFGVLTARSGQEALELLRTGRLPVLVLLDLMMPVMNGWAFLEEVVKHPALREIPVLVLTASEPEQVPGAVGILRKPFDLNVLIEAVERHARGGGGGGGAE
jgi:two-component system, chemotaxis family, chemotaxis protein CheY